MMNILHVEPIVGQAHLVPENAALDTINSVWLVNSYEDLDTYWTGN